MQVFRVYLKILSRMKLELVIYIAVFIGMTFFFNAGGGAGRDASFGDTKTPVAWIETGDATPLTAGLKESLASYAEFRELPDDEDDLRDALFYRRVEVILRVPGGFEADFLAGGNMRINRTSVPDTFGAYAIGSGVDKYLNLARAVHESEPDIDPAELAARMRDILPAGIETVFLAGRSAGQRHDWCNACLNFISYSMLAIMMHGVTSAMLSFQKSELRLRNTASPMPPRAASYQLFAGNLVFAAVVSAAMLLTAKMQFFEVIAGRMGLLLALNVSVFSLVALAISFLLARVLTGKNAVSAAANVIGLGFSFIGGAFVPQSMLGSSVLRLASFTPSYWYIKANDAIFLATDFSWKSISGALAAMGIVLAFAAALFAVTQAFLKQRADG